MNTYLAMDYGVTPNKDITSELRALISLLKEDGEEKLLTLADGRYFISRDKCDTGEYFITNTISEKEMKVENCTHERTIAVHLKGIKNLTVDGDGATLVVDGKLTNMVLSECENITIKNLHIETISPNLHRFNVVKRTPFYVDYKLGDSTRYAAENGTFNFIGNGYKYGFKRGCGSWSWNTCIRADNPESMRRRRHPFTGSVRIKELSPYLFRVYYPVSPRYAVGDEFYIFNTLRSDAGVFIEKSKNITFENVGQHFNYSLAYVAQDSENLTFRDLKCTPQAGYNMTSLADFIQICMCRGLVTVTGCEFVGAGDDVINVHGFHFPSKKTGVNTITASFCHEQSYGYNAFRIGDTVDFVDRATLVTYATAEVLASKLLNDYDVELTLSSIPSNFKDGDCVENATANPDLVFSHNYISRIVTRGMLITTRGKVTVENNTLVNTGGAGIHISDDANYWYESGRVQDVTVSGNKFIHCEGNSILIKPESISEGGYVHSGIRILDNSLDVQHGNGINLYLSTDITIKGNTFVGEGNGKKLIAKHCGDIDADIDFNRS